MTQAAAPSPEVTARVRTPGRVGSFPPDDPLVGTGAAGTVAERAVARIQVRVDPSAARIVEARFRVFGCSAAIASASLVAERIEGMAVEDAARLSADEIARDLGLAADRRHAAERAVEAVRRAVARWTDARS